jgi:hypothetical protein
VLAAERYNQSELVNRGSAFENSVRDLVGDDHAAHRIQTPDRLGVAPHSIVVT